MLSRISSEREKNMVDWNTVCEQIGKIRYKKSHGEVLDRLGLTNESEFLGSDEMPYGQPPLPQPDPPSFKVMKKQVGKKKVSKKPKKERIADKSVKLAEGLRYDPHK